MFFEMPRFLHKTPLKTPNAEDTMRTWISVVRLPSMGLLKSSGSNDSGMEPQPPESLEGCGSSISSKSEPPFEIPSQVVRSLPIIPGVRQPCKIHAAH